MRGLHKFKMDKLASDLEVSEVRVAQTLECEIKRPRDVDFLGIPLRCRKHKPMREKNHTSTKAAENDSFTVIVDMGSTKEAHGGPTKHIIRDNVKSLTFSSLDRQTAFGRTDCASVLIKENHNVINRASEENTRLAEFTRERNREHHGGGPKGRTEQQLHSAEKVALVEHGQQEDIGTTRVRIQGSDMQVAKSPTPTKKQFDTPGESSDACVGVVKSEATCYDDGDDIYLDFAPYSPSGADDSMSDDSELEKPVFGDTRVERPEFGDSRVERPVFGETRIERPVFGDTRVETRVSPNKSISNRSDNGATTDGYYSNRVECSKSRPTPEKDSRPYANADKQLLSLLLLTNPKDLLSETAHCHTQDTSLLGNRSKRTEEENICANEVEISNIQDNFTQNEEVNPCSENTDLNKESTTESPVTEADEVDADSQILEIEQTNIEEQSGSGHAEGKEPQTPNSLKELLEAPGNESQKPHLLKVNELLEAPNKQATHTRKRHRSEDEAKAMNVEGPAEKRKISPVNQTKAGYKIISPRSEGQLFLCDICNMNVHDLLMHNAKYHWF